MSHAVRIRRILAALTLCASIAIVMVPAAAAGTGLEETPVHQLRIYEVPRENRQAFHERFRDHAARIMAKYDFDIVAMWESHFDDRVEFVYLLEWPDEETMTDGWEQFMADREWARIKQETGRIHGTFVNGIEDRTLKLTDYSPHRDLCRAC